MPHIVVNTPADPQRACGIANVGIKDMDPNVLAKTLHEKYRIWTVAINRPGVQGCRITPNIYTTPKELDQFVAALKGMGWIAQCGFSALPNPANNGGRIGINRTNNAAQFVIIETYEENTLMKAIGNWLFRAAKFV